VLSHETILTPDVSSYVGDIVERLEREQRRDLSGHPLAGDQDPADARLRLELNSVRGLEEV
jgi:prephenate dehydrogenase